MKAAPQDRSSACSPCRATSPSTCARSRRPARGRHRCAARRNSTAIDGLVIPGGESTTLWRLSVAFDMLEPLRKLVAPACPRSGPAPG